MATLIPSIGSCVSRMTGGERRLAERLEAKLDDDYNPSTDIIQIMTVKVRKALGFPVVALPGVGHSMRRGGGGKKAARVFYAAATRETHRLVVTMSGDDGYGSQLGIDQ